MNAETLFGLAGMGFAVLISALSVVIVVYLTKVWQAKIQTDKDQQLQKIKADSAEYIKKTQEYHAEIEKELEGLKKRISTVEKILQEVE